MAILSATERRAVLQSQQAKAAEIAQACADAKSPASWPPSASSIEYAWLPCRQVRQIFSAQ